MKGSPTYKLLLIPYHQIMRIKRVINDYLGGLYSRYNYQDYCSNLSKCDVSDLDQVISIYKNSFDGNAEKTIKKYQNLFNNTFYVLNLDGETIGYCIYYIHLKFKNLKITPVATIYSIAITSDKRGKHFGKMLLEESIIELKMNNINSVYLYVDKENIRAINLYNKNGFAIVGSKDDICGVGKKCYKMELCTN